MLQNVIDGTRFYIFYRLSSPSTYLQLQLSHSQSQPQNIFMFYQGSSKGVPQQSFNAIHRTASQTEDQGRNTIIKLSKTAYNSFSKV